MQGNRAGALRLLWSVLVVGAACAPGRRSAADMVGEVPLVLNPSIAAAAGVTAFVDVGVVPMDNERVLAHHTVLIEGDRIATVGPAAKVKVPLGATRIDGQGKYLIPGLADMHTHVNGILLNRATTLEQRLLLFVAHGITTIRNMDYASSQRGDDVLRARAEAAAGRLLSPRIYTSGYMGVTPNTELREIADKVTAYKAAGYDFIKIRDETPIVFDSIAAAARRVGITFADHLPKGMELQQGIRAGFASIEHLPGFYTGRLGVDAFTSGRTATPTESRSGSVALAEQLARAIRDAGIAICPTEVVYWSDPMSPVARDFHSQLIKAIQKVGAILLLGSDPFTNNRYGVSTHRELQLLVTEIGLTPYQALAAGTRNPAVFFGTLNESGTVAAGKRADLVLLNGNPFADIRNTARPAGVMLGGRWLNREELGWRLNALGAPGGE